MNNSATNEKIALSSRLRHRAVGDEGVLIHLDNGRVIVVNEVGLHIVQQLATPQTRQALAESITRTFDVDATQAEADLDLYLAELEKEQVLDIDQNANPGARSDLSRKEHRPRKNGVRPGLTRKEHRSSKNGVRPGPSRL